MSKTPIIYTLTSLTCRESWTNTDKWCDGCHTDGDCYGAVERMTTDPGCPIHATVGAPARRAHARVVYRYVYVGSEPDDDWMVSCLTPPSETRGGALPGSYCGDGTDEDAIAWLLGGP